MTISIRISLVFLLTILVGCAAPGSVRDRRSTAERLASAAQWHKEPIKTENFYLVSYMPDAPSNYSVVNVYIEGDGAAWTNSITPSKDPTPRDPIALKLALAQPSGYAVYLARPCQYLKRKLTECDAKNWTYERFSKRVVNATNEAVTKLKERADASEVRLIGFSGGGAIATLVAAQRSDVIQLVTVSGNLDTEAWTLFHGLTNLDGLNPISVASQLQDTPQVHFVGSSDENTTPELVEGFIRNIPKPNNAQLIVKNGMTHNCCWVNEWSALWEQYVSPSAGK